MKRAGALLALVTIGVGLAIVWAAYGAADDPKTAVVKPTAPAAVIDASKFPSLQAAFDAVPESGGLVKLPPGDFRIEKPLVLSRGNTRVEGAGAATRLINCNQQGEPAMIIRGAKPKARLWRVQVADFRISGDPNAVDGKSTKPKGGDGLLVENVDEFYAHGMSVDHNGGHGIHLLNCVEDPRVADSILTYNAKAGLNIFGSHDIVVNANHFEENQDALRCADSFNLCMNGNNLDDHLRDGVVIENTYGSVLSGNMIEECNGLAVVLDRECYGITISANVIADNFGGGVDLRGAWGCAVSANTFTITAVRALRVGPKSGRITITGNNFSDSFIGPKCKRKAEANRATGVFLEGTSDITVTGNIFSGLSTEAIHADAACRRILISANVMTDLNRDRQGKGKSIELGGAKEVVESQNLLDQPK